MKIYDYNDGEVKEITEAQYDFIQLLVKHGGRIDSLLKEYPVPQAELDAWHSDTTFWPIVEGYIRVMVKAKGLSLDKVKEFLIDVLSGKKEPTKQQMNAANQAIRALGVGYAPRQGFNGKVTISPDNTVVEFQDGLNEKQSQDTDRPIP